MFSLLRGEGRSEGCCFFPSLFCSFFRLYCTKTKKKCKKSGEGDYSGKGWIASLECFGPSLLPFFFSPRSFKGNDTDTLQIFSSSFSLLGPSLSRDDITLFLFKAALNRIQNGNAKYYLFPSDFKVNHRFFGLS